VPGEKINQFAERSLRGIAVGRENWMFNGSDNGGQTAAVLASIIATSFVSASAWTRSPAFVICSGASLPTPTPASSNCPPTSGITPGDQLLHLNLHVLPPGHP